MVFRMTYTKNIEKSLLGVSVVHMFTQILGLRFCDWFEETRFLLKQVARYNIFCMKEEQSALGNVTSH